ncbi:MAG TPA: poly-beta-hydroxybutyrate polymerase N-terminal domain-containing protein, partial [Ramlibacter sp.]|nr:poly-beta-hydroxybutyrate polymerase N-terminal domain-containing protein [Ramlibacter sp.]
MAQPQKVSMTRNDQLHRSHVLDPLDLPLKLWLARLTNGISPASVALAYSDWLSHALTSPSHQAELAGS